MWNPYAELPAGRRRLMGFGSVALVVVIWAVLASAGIVSPAKLPSPAQVADGFVQLAWVQAKVNQFGNPIDAHSPLLGHIKWSLIRVLVAGMLVVSIGTPIGILMGASPRINALLSPLIDPFRSAPVVALLPIMVMWLGIGEAMKVAFLFLGAVVFLVPMVRDAIVAVPQEHWISARDLGASPWEAIWHAVVPMAKPRIADAITVSISVMWTYITVAEYVNATEGLGALMAHFNRFSATDKVLVGIIVIIALALVTHALLTALKKWLYPWEAEG